MTNRRIAISLACLGLGVGVLSWSASSSNGGPAARHDPSVTEGMDCSACHTTDGWALASGGGGGFDHARTGFPLTGQHARTSCGTCHKPKVKLGRDCASCHKDQHRGRFGAGCDDCHNARDWTDTRAIARHQLTRLPLTGVHALLDCTSCHVRRTEGTWSDVPADCFGCHEADYRRPDVHPPHQGDPLEPDIAPLSRQCQQCHRAISWSPAFVRAGVLASVAPPTASPRHELKFPIASGKHRGATCEGCHVTLRLPRLVRCTGCHAHAGAALLASHRGSRVATDGAACLRCHPGGTRR